MPCPSCSSAYLDPYGRCPACQYYGPPAPAVYPVSYAAPTAPTGVATAAQILLAIQAFGSVGTVIADLLALVSLGSDGDIGTVSTAIGALSTVLLLPTFVASVVLVIIWFHKARTNADILTPGEPKSFSKGWAIGGWFLPIGFCWIPRGVAGDIWAASHPLSEDTGWTNRRRSGLLTAWWTCWCLMWAAEIMYSGFNSSEDRYTLSGRESAVTANLLGAGCRIAAAVLLLLVIRRITTMQQIRILQGPGANHPYSAPVPIGYAPLPYPPQPFYAPQPYVPTQPPSAPAVDLDKKD